MADFFTTPPIKPTMPSQPETSVNIPTDLPSQTTSTLPSDQSSVQIPPSYNPKKKKRNIAMIISGIILLLITVPLAGLVVKNSTEIRSQAAGPRKTLYDPSAIGNPKERQAARSGNTEASGGTIEVNNDTSDAGPDCISIDFINANGDLMTDADLAALKPGDDVTIGLYPPDPVSKVRFQVNNQGWNETTDQTDGEYYWNYTLDNTSSFHVQAQWFDGTNWIPTIPASTDVVCDATFTITATVIPTTATDEPTDTPSDIQTDASGNPTDNAEDIPTDTAERIPINTTSIDLPVTPVLTAKPTATPTPFIYIQPTTPPIILTINPIPTQQVTPVPPPPVTSTILSGITAFFQRLFQR